LNLRPDAKSMHKSKVLRWWDGHYKIKKA